MILVIVPMLLSYEQHDILPTSSSERVDYMTIILLLFLKYFYLSLLFHSTTYFVLCIVWNINFFS